LRIVEVIPGELFPLQAFDTLGLGFFYFRHVPLFLCFKKVQKHT
jgi:hypothetical protein